MKDGESINSFELQSIQLSLDGIPVIKDLDLKVTKNGIHCFLGPNGTGKTLTNKIIGLLLSPNDGIIKWNNRSLDIDTEKQRRELRQKIGFMFQNPVFLKRSLFENIEVPLVMREYPREKRKKIVEEGLKVFQLAGLSSRRPQKLSIGQQQKAALLRTLIHEPNLIILDEPTASLDLANTKWFEQHIKEVRENLDPMILWTSHDQFQIRRIAKSVSIINKGKIEDNGEVNAVFSNPMTDFTKAYLEGKLL